MLVAISLALSALIYSSQGLPRPGPAAGPVQVAPPADPRQIVYVPSERQQYAPDLHYDLSLLEPQFQIPYNFIGDKSFPRVQPQILYYGGAAPGQPFLLQPGPPPGNFLVPQPGPNVILRDSPHNPQRPIFVAGYPKPAHIPPIEKDAEEVPTNPAKIPPLVPRGNSNPTANTPSERKPEKLETFNEDDNKKTSSEADALAAADRNSFLNARNNLQPGQRFFILNGQPLFSSYPFHNQIYTPSINPNINFKYTEEPELFQPTDNNKDSIAVNNLLVRNGVTGQIDDIAAQRNLPDGAEQIPQHYSGNLISLNQPENFQNDAIFRTAIPLEIAQTKDIKLPLIKDNSNNAQIQDENNDDSDDDSIIIDAREQDEVDNDSNNSNNNDSTTEAENQVSSAAPVKSGEPTISQSGPLATALAGPGGVAAAAPRGTAFVGKDGVAVASPQATAVAGPTREKEDANKKPQTKRKL